METVGSNTERHDGLYADLERKCRSLIESGQHDALSQMVTILQLSCEPQEVLQYVRTATVRQCRKAIEVHDKARRESRAKWRPSR